MWSSGEGRSRSGSRASRRSRGSVCDVGFWDVQTARTPELASQGASHPSSGVGTLERHTVSRIPRSTLGRRSHLELALWCGPDSGSALVQARAAQRGAVLSTSLRWPDVSGRMSHTAHVYGAFAEHALLGSCCLADGIRPPSRSTSPMPLEHGRAMPLRVARSSRISSRCLKLESSGRSLDHFVCCLCSGIAAYRDGRAKAPVRGNGQHRGGPSGFYGGLCRDSTDDPALRSRCVAPALELVAHPRSSPCLGWDACLSGCSGVGSAVGYADV